jgi:amidase
MTTIDFDVQEATVESIHQAFATGELTAAALVDIYLDRIERFDRNGPKLNSFITLSSHVREEAEALDRHFAETGSFIGPLHGIPLCIKDQIETRGIVTTFGSIAQAGYMPDEDAHAIARLKAAGALILGKTAMPDWATSWFGFCSMQGETRNPMALDHECGGSSSGTAAAVSANLCLAGLGEDTGGSIRLPASFCNLVGFRVTPGLISRHGMSPLVVSQDTAGPMTRAVRDAALLLDTMVGFDARDDMTIAAEIGGWAGEYVHSLDPVGGLAGARIGLLTNRIDAERPETADEVEAIVDKAVAAMKRGGATIVPVEIPDLMEWIIATSVYLDESRANIDAFLASRSSMPVKSLDAIRDAEQFEPTLDLLVSIFDGPSNPAESLEYHEKLRRREEFQRVVAGIMAAHKLDALTFPAVRILPPSRTDIRAGRYDCLSFPTNTLIASQALMPSICLPAGFSSSGLPVGVELITYPYHETTLFKLGSAFEHLTKQRKAPAMTY